MQDFGLSLAGRVAVVTGGAGGIGEQICADLAALDARVVVADVREADAKTVANRREGRIVVKFPQTRGKVLRNELQICRGRIEDR